MAISFHIDMPAELIGEDDVPSKLNIAEILRYANLMHLEFCTMQNLVHMDVEGTPVGKSFFTAMHTCRFLTAYARTQIQFMMFRSWNEMDKSLRMTDTVSPLLLKADLYGIISAIGEYLKADALGKQPDTESVFKAIAQFNRDFCIFIDEEKNLEPSIRQDVTDYIAHEGKLYAEKFIQNGIGITSIENS